MNIILEGPDAVGKTTLAEKLKKKYNMQIINSTAKTRNDFAYHIDLLDYQNNTVFDRFHIGEMVYPEVYSRPGKLSLDEFHKINQRIIDNNDILIVFICTNMDIISERLIARGELDYLAEMDLQNKLFTQWANIFTENYCYKNFYIIDIAENNCYNKLDDWIDCHINKSTVNTAYRNLCRNLLESGHIMETRNIRGNTKELCNYMFTIDDLDTEYVTLKTGKSDLTYLSGELLWYWSSRNDTDFIGKFGSMWTKLSDDGITNNSAYGYLLQEKHGFNQIEKIIELLTVDKYSRRAVLNINVPNENVINTKDEPCTISLIFQIRNNKLHQTVIMRSNDIRMGLRNDLGYFISLQKYIAKRLNIKVGTYTHFAASIHFYDKDFKFVKDVAYGTMETSNERLNISRLIENKDYLINYIDNNWESKDEFKKLLISKNIIEVKL